jgi:hypothetical protein
MLTPRRRPVPGDPRGSEVSNVGIAMLLIAHAGHVLTSIAYFVPVVAFLVWLLVTQIRERRGRSGQERRGG